MRLMGAMSPNDAVSITLDVGVVIKSLKLSGYTINEIWDA